MLTRPQRHFHHHTARRTIHQLGAQLLPVSGNFRRKTLLVSLPSLRCNERGHLQQIYGFFKTWLHRIWELFIRLEHHLSHCKCCFVENKWFCCTFSNELLLIHPGNKPFVCIYVHMEAVIKENAAGVTTRSQVFVKVPSLRWWSWCKCKCHTYRKMLFLDWFQACMINTRLKFSKVISPLIKQFTEIIKRFPLQLRFFVSTMRAKKRPRLVTKIIVLTSWGGVAALCAPCPDHLSITQRSRGGGWGREWRTSSTHTHWRTRCRCSEAWLAAALPWMRPLRIDLHTNKNRLILAHMWTRTDYTVYISMLRLNGVNFLWPI